MTDPRMTPTNDAPVTVEQCDREAAARERTAEYEGYGFKAESLETPTEMRRGHRDWDPLVQKHARHRLAALASAPAGDGFGAIVLIDGKRPDWVRDDDWLLMRRKATGQWRWRSWYGFNWNDFDAIRARPDHPYYAVAPAGDGVEKEAASFLFHAGVHENTDRAIGLIPYPIALRAVRAALARPRAAVGEREREALREAIAILRAKAKDFRKAAFEQGEQTGPLAASYEHAADFLALQSPPAKVEG